MDDPVAAVAKLTDMERAAKQKLGKPADQLMDRPGKDEPVADWMKKNAALFGIPESPDKYEVKPPENWPKDAKWNTELEGKAREIAHKHGLSGAALQDIVNLEAENIMGLMGKAQADLETATAEMRAQLVKDWGDQYPVKEAQAKAAAQVIAEVAGLDNTALEQIAGTLSPKVGDANVIRMFQAIGEMMGDDRLSAFNGGGGGGSLTTTPAEARAELNKLRAPGGEYFEATKGGPGSKVPEQLQRRIEHLTKLAAQGQKV
ncbi:hypothetical protein [Seohaeicola zhoushanensis]|uniref:hypothetical protein n=1 Tax=Seohaeicola zhoushanensis TaxID=1569283 RepID=UPI00167BCAB4|nr:hypothetical protein [Seohaeicola zhoushanensis]